MMNYALVFVLLAPGCAEYRPHICYEKEKVMYRAWFVRLNTSQRKNEISGFHGDEYVYGCLLGCYPDE
jgi:hypothetical protein